MKKNIKDFVEKQEALNDIRTSLSKIHKFDGINISDEYLDVLTEKTFEIMTETDIMFNEFLETDRVAIVSEQLNVTKEEVAKGIVELMLYSTIAKQSLLIEELKGIKD